jgi:hypothetical protein
MVSTPSPLIFWNQSDTGGLRSKFLSLKSYRENLGNKWVVSGEGHFDLQAIYWLSYISYSEVKGIAGKLLRSGAETGKVDRC